MEKQVFVDVQWVIAPYGAGAEQAGQNRLRKEYKL